MQIYEKDFQFFENAKFHCLNVYRGLDNILPGQFFFILQPDFYALFLLIFADVLFYALQLEYIFILSY